MAEESPEIASWHEYRISVLDKLSDLKAQIATVNTKLDERAQRHQIEIADLRVRVGMLEVRAGLLGAGAGIAVAILARFVHL